MLEIAKTQTPAATKAEVLTIEGKKVTIRTPQTDEKFKQLEDNILEGGAVINLYRLILGLLVRPRR
ncbi:MAG: hypothetical protein LUC47_01175 [Clostridiales bacterium]|nr:hypothetical protein [Clostridiales bacterium]